jgi:hypothetical protein
MPRIARFVRSDVPTVYHVISRTALDGFPLNVNMGTGYLFNASAPPTQSSTSASRTKLTCHQFFFCALRPVHCALLREHGDRFFVEEIPPPCYTSFNFSDTLSC